MYGIRKVDGHEDGVADTLADLHRLTFFDSASVPPFDWGHCGSAFMSGCRSPLPELCRRRAQNAGYSCRVGVLKRHCGRELQLRLMRTMQTRASDQMGQHPFRHDRQSRLGEQLYPGRLSVVPTAFSLGLAEHVVLAKIDQLQGSRMKTSIPILP
jgi:hypothetical protein